MTDKLGLDALPADGGKGKPLLSDEEWAEVKRARDRGVTYKAIFAVIGRYRNLDSFTAAYQYRFKAPK
jgi:hypothetical protein